MCRWGGRHIFDTLGEYNCHHQAKFSPMESQVIDVDSHQFYTIKHSQVSARANLLIVHGFGEHIGRYSTMIEELSSLSLNIFAYDRRGEGQSTGRRAYIHHMDDQVSDLKSLKAKLIPNKLPTFLYGHSLGGLISTKYVIDNPDHGLAGLLLSGALLKVDDDISPLLQKISGLVAAILPTLPTVRVDTALLSRSPWVQSAYQQDPLVYHGGTPARTGHQILQATAYVQSRFHNVSLPVLITHGGADKLADPAGSRMMHSKVSSGDNTLKVFEGLYHEVMHEPERSQFINLMKTWLADRTT